MKINCHYKKISLLGFFLIRLDCFGVTIISSKATIWFSYWWQHYSYCYWQNGIFLSLGKYR